MGSPQRSLALPRFAGVSRRILMRASSTTPEYALSESSSRATMMMSRLMSPARAEWCSHRNPPLKIRSSTTSAGTISRRLRLRCRRRFSRLLAGWGRPVDGISRRGMLVLRSQTIQWSHRPVRREPSPPTTKFWASLKTRQQTRSRAHGRRLRRRVILTSVLTTPAPRRGSKRRALRGRCWVTRMLGSDTISLFKHLLLPLPLRRRRQFRCVWTVEVSQHLWGLYGARDANGSTTVEQDQHLNSIVPLLLRHRGSTMDSVTR